MARPKLRTADQPKWLQFALGTYEFCASLKLAVIVISVSSIVLGWATVVDSWYGMRGVQFGIYGTWWFSLLNAVLALNIFCAAAIRFPWKRHQTGFVITHLGLLTLLFGCLLSRRYGIDAQMSVFEGGTGHVAQEDSQHIALEIFDDPQAAASAMSKPSAIEPIPVRTGPFNWREIDEEMPFVPWRLARRDRGVVHDEDGIRIEVLDYLSNCREVAAPYVRLRLSMPQMAAGNSDASGPMDSTWIPIDLENHQTPQSSARRRTAFPVEARRSNGFGDLQRRGGGSFAFWMAGSEAEKVAFLDAAPQGDLGASGQIVLHIDGQKHTLNVDDAVAAEIEEKEATIPLGNSGWTARVVEHVPAGELFWDEASGAFRLVPGSFAGATDSPAVALTLQSGDREEHLILFADRPQLNQQAYDADIIGSYWVDRGDQTTNELLQGRGASRIDILAVSEDELYYRYWNRSEIVAADRMETEAGIRGAVDAFKMPMAQLQMYVEEYVPSDVPQFVPVAIPYDKDITAPMATRAARVRLTLDDEESEFWLMRRPAMIVDQPLNERERRVVGSKDRSVALTLPLDEVDIGYQVRLRKFERKLDPGTSQAAHYGSKVDILDIDDGQPLKSNVSIVMNAPIDFSDPMSGRSYRLFQESFHGPYVASESQFAPEIRRAANQRGEVFASVLTVNYDPGRGTKYTGSLLIVAGIATMFYMRAYFFKPQLRSEPSRRVPAREVEAKQEIPQPVS